MQFIQPYIEFWPALTKTLNHRRFDIARD